MNKPIKVLIIDDSALVRQTLTEIISGDSQLKVIGTASDPYFAANKIKEMIPDVITLDIEMPRMNGLTFLKALMTQYPIPVVIISSLTEQGSLVALQALERGALEIVSKSEIKIGPEHREESSMRITDAIKAAFMAKTRRIAFSKPAAQRTDVLKTKSQSLPISTTADRVLAIGASTGGTQALRFLLKNQHTKCPGILIVQHMPSGFTKSFADGLNDICAINVKEAADGDTVMNGHAYVCPGGRHMTLGKIGTAFKIRLHDGELVNRHRPSVDVLFKSVAENVRHQAVGVILTGMGRDGAEGLWYMKKMGAITVAQNEESCVVFGMPKEAIKLNAADHILSLEEMAGRLSALFSVLD